MNSRIKPNQTKPNHEYYIIPLNEFRTEAPKYIKKTLKYCTCVVWLNKKTFFIDNIIDEPTKLKSDRASTTCWMLDD
jgi:predicted choloylglycine hydrolase